MPGKSIENMHVAVLAGGHSAEREISLDSGKNVVVALKEAGYTSVELLDTAADDFMVTMATGGFDVAFIAMHGAGGEDGAMQGAIETLGIPYTASGVLASACGADKEVSKLLYAKAGIPIAPGLALEVGDEVDIDHIVEVCGERCFVKPAVNGSSYGISLVHEPSELPAAIAKAFEYGDKVLVEKCIEGTEITVGVYGEDDVRALPIVEIRKPEDCEFYDLDVKYVDPTDIHRIPAQISPENYARAQELACAAHKALGCLGISRSDFIVSEDGPVILETNTIPGMTDTSLYPDEIRHTDDMTFPQVCDSLIRMAFVERALHANRGRGFVRNAAVCHRLLCHACRPRQNAVLRSYRGRCDCPRYRDHGSFGAGQ